MYYLYFPESGGAIVGPFPSALAADNYRQYLDARCAEDLGLVVTAAQLTLLVGDRRHAKGRAA